jgi:hypothetical protein
VEKGVKEKLLEKLLKLLKEREDPQEKGEIKNNIYILRKYIYII